MNIFHVILLAVVQGLAELLPVSSSAHVILVSKLLHLDPTSPQNTWLLIMLHTGTMFAVIVYFWPAWKRSFFASREVFKTQAVRLVAATILTVAIGGPLILGIEKGAEKFGLLTKDASGHLPKAEIELLFGNLGLIAAALASVGVLILIAGLVNRKTASQRELGMREALGMGAIQGLCLPFRGFSRSGATISVGLLLGAAKIRVEEFSFALAVLITPPAIARELWRLFKAGHETGNLEVVKGAFGYGLLGAFFAFLAGLVALRWLSRWLEHGRWHYFGLYCLLAAGVAFVLHTQGY